MFQDDLLHYRRLILVLKTARSILTTEVFACVSWTDVRQRKEGKEGSFSIFEMISSDSGDTFHVVDLHQAQCTDTPVLMRVFA
jgi:hypothetical protein